MELIENRLTVAIGALAAVGGILLLALASGFAAVLAGALLLGLAGISLVALAFLLVGQSEDDDRRRRPLG
jgi:hypothetical protein